MDSYIMNPSGKKGTPLILIFNAIPIHMLTGFFTMEEQRAKNNQLWRTGGIIFPTWYQELLWSYLN